MIWNFVKRLMFNKQYNVIIFRVWTALVIFYTIYMAYLLGWTNKFMPQQYNEWDSWSARAAYVNKGIVSVAHLNIVSIAAAVCIIIIPYLAYIYLFKTDILVSKSHIYFLSIVVIFGLSVYTFITMDIPNNYYASRYFVPIIIPAVIMLFITITDRLNSKFVLACVVGVALTFNLGYDLNLLKNPVFLNRFNIINSIGGAIPKNNYVFTNIDPFSRRLLARNLENLESLHVINIKVEDNKNEYNSIIDKVKPYTKELKLNQVYYLTTARLDGYNPVKVFNFDNRLHPWTIMYPTTVDRSQFEYYLYHFDLEFVGENKTFYSIQNGDKDYFINMYGEGDEISTWTKASSSIKLYYAHAKNDIEVVLNMGGERPKDNPADINIYINDHKIDSFSKGAGLLKKSIRVPNKYLNHDTIQMLRIDTDCWKPSDYGMSDNRELGIQIYGVELKEMER